MSNDHENALKQWVRHSQFYPLVLEARYRYDYCLWVKGGRSGRPPHLLKRKVVLCHARRFGLRHLIETGTFRGAMVEATRRHFETVQSIELDDHWYAAARSKFDMAPNVMIHHGDSADILPRLLAEASEPCLFWLDGHFSGPGTGSGRHDTPILEELQAILEHSERHVVLIDDQHDFVGANGYPTVEYLRTMVAAARPTARFMAADNIIRIMPK